MLLTAGDRVYELAEDEDRRRLADEALVAVRSGGGILGFRTRAGAAISLVLPPSTPVAVTESDATNPSTPTTPVMEDEAADVPVSFIDLDRI